MKIAVILGSHRREGKNKEIEDMLIGLNLEHELDFIRMADTHIFGCTTCYECAKTNKCVLDDDFEAIYKKLIAADMIFIITPVYAIIPSRLTALFERLTSLLFASGLLNTENNPLLGKKVAVFSYCSSQICDEKDIKYIFQKFVMTGYSFDAVNYRYINDCPNANEKYNYNICEYIKNVALAL
ncbi:MAG: flavodoxin family protein [Oscillospiraceae bacterium]|nr:flavodoxin family protein [Oscillospiraceae bacterium]